MADIDTSTTRVLYRTMRVSELLTLREAFRLDAVEAREAGRLTTMHFCEERMALIGAVLKEKARLRRVRQQRAEQTERKEG